jgi:hypothetical protein
MLENLFPLSLLIIRIYSVFDFSIFPSKIIPSSVITLYPAKFQLFWKEYREIELGGMIMDQNEPNMHESEEANQEMSEKFKDYNPRTVSAADSEIERTNQSIQRQVYENKEDNNFLPFHIDISNPPIKK